MHRIRSHLSETTTGLFHFSEYGLLFPPALTLDTRANFPFPPERHRQLRVKEVVHVSIRFPVSHRAISSIGYELPVLRQYGRRPHKKKTRPSLSDIDQVYYSFTLQENVIYQRLLCPSFVFSFLYVVPFLCHHSTVLFLPSVLSYFLSML